MGTPHVPTKIQHNWSNRGRDISTNVPAPPHGPGKQVILRRGGTAMGHALCTCLTPQVWHKEFTPTHIDDIFEKKERNTANTTHHGPSKHKVVWCVLCMTHRLAGDLQKTEVHIAAAK